MEDKIEIWNKKLNLIKKIDSKHTKFYFLMKYMNISKMNYLIKNMEYKLNDPWISEIDELLDNIKNIILDFNLTEEQRLQTQLPTRLGGLAMRNIKQVMATAKLSNLMGNRVNKKEKILFQYFMIIIILIKIMILLKKY